MNKIKIFIIIIFSLLFASIKNVSVLAYQGGGGKTNVGCDVNNNIYSYQNSGGACEHSGVGWMYYKYDTAAKVDLSFGATSTNSGGNLTISSVCVDYGGFWHYGYFQYKSYTNTYGGTKTSYSGFGQVGNPKYNDAVSVGHESNRNKNVSKVNKNVSHRFYDGSGNQIAHAVEAADDNTVSQYYDEYIAASGDRNIWKGEISYFCWGEGMQKTTFTMSTSGTVNGNAVSNNQTHTISGDSVSFSFNHNVHRNNDGPDKGIRSAYFINKDTIGPANYNNDRTYYLKWDYYSWTSYLNKGGDANYSDSRTLSISPGQTRSAWSTGRVYGTVQGDKYTDIKVATNSRFTMTFYRKPATFSGSTTADVSVTGNTGTASNGGSKSLTTGADGAYDITFTHTITRGVDGAGGNVNPYYNTSVSNSLQNANMVGSGERATAKSWQGMGAMSEGGSKSTTDHFSGTLYPGETRTFCENMTYQSKIDAGSGNVNSNTRSTCITVTRPNVSSAKDCSNTSHTFGINSASENYGALCVYNRTNGASGTATSGETTIWAKPGDVVYYRHDITAAAQMKTDYYQQNGTSSYIYNGSNSTASQQNKIKYLFASDGLFSGTSTSTQVISSKLSKGTDAAAKYAQTIYSPNTNASTYKCNNNSHNVGYQVVEYGVSGCASATKVGRDTSSTPVLTNASDAGSIISQSVSFQSTPGGSFNKSIVGNIKIPYNYMLRFTDNNDNPGAKPVSPGTDFTYKINVSVEKRCNLKVANITSESDCTNKTYKTVPKPTQVRIFTYTISSTLAANRVGEDLRQRSYGTNAGNIGYSTTVDPANNRYFRTIFSSNNIFSSNDMEKATLTSAQKVEIPSDAAIGSKVCVAYGVYPYDSHNQWTTSTIYDDTQSAALTTNGDNHWFIGKPTCYTVGKKPSFAVRGAGIYAAGNINASPFSKNNLTYGSWSEYTIASRGSIKGVASGAALWNGRQATTHSCSFSSMTLANEQCRDGDLGKLSQDVVGKSQSNPQDIVKQVTTRYTANIPNSKKVQNDYPIDAEGGCGWDSGSSSYVPTQGSKEYFNCLSNGSFYFEAKSGVTMHLGDKSIPNSLWYSGTDNPYTGHTTIYKADNIVINEDLRLGDRYLQDNSVFTSTSHQTQILIIANSSITISDNVGRVDAWLIAPTIKTCDIDPNNININQCNKQLFVNGPVFTKHLLLYRTHGAGQNSTTQGTNSYSAQSNSLARPAEIFTIPVSTYFWTYSQSTRYSQAATTYQRELAPRY